MPTDPAKRYDIELFIRQLRSVALAEAGLPCPVDDPVVAEKLSTLQIASIKALWRLNTNGLNAWSVPLEAFVGEVWGERGATVETVRTAISRLCTNLMDQGISFEAAVHVGASLKAIDCKFSA